MALLQRAERASADASCPVGSPSTEKSTLMGKGDRDEEEPSAKQRLQTTASIAALIVIAVTKTQVTAYLFSYSKVPTAYSLWSCIVTCLLLVPCFALKLSPFAWPTAAMTRVLTLIVVFTAVDLGFTNIALANISTALQQCIASTNPFWTLMIETALYRKCQHRLVYATVATIVLGAVLASVGSVTRTSTYGVAAACMAVLSSASKYVFTHSAFKEFKSEMGALSLLFWVDIFMCPIYFVWTILNGELALLFSDVFTSASTFWLMTATAALGGVRALTQYLVLIFVTATSMSTANVLTQSLNILISIPLQSTALTPHLAFGIGLVIPFSALYALIKAHKPCLPMLDAKLSWAPHDRPRDAAAAS